MTLSNTRRGRRNDHVTPGLGARKLFVGPHDVGTCIFHASRVHQDNGAAAETTTNHARTVNPRGFAGGQLDEIELLQLTMKLSRKLA